MVQYSVLGEFIDLRNPYSLDATPPVNPLATGTGIIVGTMAASTGVATNWKVVYDAPVMFWPFRLPVEDRPNWVRPWEEGATNWPGDVASTRRKRLEVQPYRVVKSICIPYNYTRVVAELSGSPHNVAMKSHILIGFTAPETAPDSLSGETYRSSILPTALMLIPGYHELGDFIEQQHPVKTGELGVPAANTQLNVDLDNPAAPLIKLAIAWLEHDSKLRKLEDMAVHTGDETEVFLPSSADEEMDLHQEQECLTWTFPQPTRLIGGAYTSGSWIRAYQITKAFAVRYTVSGGVNDGKVGDILIGYSGSGDC